jgi:nickel-dependent lactate racemase
VRAGDRVAVVIPDITRPLPTDRLLRWLLAELAHVPAEQVTIINGTGSHRANTPEELSRMVGADVAARCRIVNHDAHDPATLRPAGLAPGGEPVLFNREYVEADRRIVLGLIEPHFMAGFSGGYKGIFPALADIASILRYHGARVIGDPRSTWGELEGNPTQELIRHNGALLPVDFCVNVTVNRDRAITGLFCGEVMPAHLAGCAFARSTAMVACPEPFPIVVTTTSTRRSRACPRRRRSSPTAATSRPPPVATTASPPTATSSACSSTTPRRARSWTRSRRRASRSTTSGRRRSWR